MAFGKNIRTFFEGKWHEGDIPVMFAADHGIWQGSSVFDGARFFDGVAPDLDLHLARVNRSAAALATRHLAALGHRRIAFLYRPGRRTIQRRYEGWRDVLAGDFEPALILEAADWTAEAAQRSVSRALEQGLDFTAIVAAGDILAAGAISALVARLFPSIWLSIANRSDLP